MTPAVFLDRDGVLTEDVNYTYKLSDYRLLPGVEALRHLNSAGFKLIILTNQSGIGRGIYSENDYANFTKRLLSDLQELGVVISSVFHCPHLPEDSCACRKPKPGLVEKAESAEGPVDYARSFAIGDKDRDLAAVKNFNPKTRGIIIPKNNGLAAEEAPSADFKAKNLKEAVEIILNAYEQR